MRLEGQIKLGYYKTPPSVVEKVKTWLLFQNNTWGSKYLLFDPCAGEGDAILSVADMVAEVGATPILCAGELDETRYKTLKSKARQSELISNVVHAPYERVKWEPDSMSLLWLNPPYDVSGGGDGGTRRKEIVFLENLLPYLKSKGILVYIIPHRYISDYMARYLGENFEQIRIFSFDDESDGYDDYNQVVIIGRKHKQQIVDESVVEMLIDARSNRPPVLHEIPRGELPYLVPLSLKFGNYTVIEYDAADIIEYSRASNAWDRMYEDVFAVERNIAGNRPPIPLHSGHIGLLLASGELNGAFGMGPLPIEDVDGEKRAKWLGAESEKEAQKMIAELKAEKSKALAEIAEEKRKRKELEGSGRRDHYAISVSNVKLNELNAKLREIDLKLTYDTRHAVKGTALLKTHKVVETDEEGNTTEREIEQQTVSIKALTAQGEVVTLV